MAKTIAVIDIGMTNKKIAIYSASLELLAIEKKLFPPLIVDGLEAHDLDGMEAWFFSTLKALSASYDIGALAICAHGATFVCADAGGRAVLPCLYYTHEPGPEFHKRFYAMAGDPCKLQVATGTPALSALINSAKGFFFARERWPEAYARMKLALPYPQYWGGLLTGITGVEGTYVGCHTYLYDWIKNDYSSVARGLDLAGKLPRPIRNSWEILGTVLPEVADKAGLSPDTIVTMGIHDSNASLLPYLVKGNKTDFIVNSTGTWCVLMHPQERYGFAPDEIGKVVFFNRSAYNKPVKTAIFFGGWEYETWSSLSRSLVRSAATTSPNVSPDAALYAKILCERSVFILPEIVPGSGQFPGSMPQAVENGIRYSLADIESGRSMPAFIRNPAVAEAALNLSLALQTIVALERAGLAPGQKIFIEGGFRNNLDYNALLAAALPANSILLTDMGEATSFGAALTGLAALEGKNPSELASLFSIQQIQAQSMPSLVGLDDYRKEWLRLIAANV
ncbi:MAG: FGGY family carbohydrate kinase [Rectinemataceae bacterium]|nr:FGGY family carbohydrate kinase [Rectinemataceae bacterium]